MLCQVVANASEKIKVKGWGGGSYLKNGAWGNSQQ